MTEPRSETHSASNIQQMLRQAEMQQIQLKSEITFKRNMEAFKQVAPQIYDQYSNYQPEELRLIYSDDGYLNIANYKLNNKLVYTGDPAAFCEAQFESFKKRPTLSTITFSKSKITNEDHIHPRVINDLIAQTELTKEGITQSTDVPIGFMLITGCGLGYHIEKVVAQLDIQNLCIFDPHKDSFYASLHTIDWIPILQKMCNGGRMLKFFIGVEPKDAMADMKLLTDKIGLFNIVHTFVFRHFSSKKETEFLETYRKEFHLAAAGTGFFDDEQISLAHSIYNINQHYPFLHGYTQLIGDAPVFLIGNGPSLDQHIDYIRANQDNAVIITCGTAISSLAKTGIKPDFHIEMERSAVTPSYILHGTSAEYRKGVRLICLNTAAPQMTELFDEVCLALKPNDLGALFIEQLYREQTPPKLTLCNPTVTNAGLSAAIQVGFRNMVFIGIDLGMKSDEAHHSALSIYHDIEKKSAEKTTRKRASYKIAGNFGGEVSTNPILHATRSNMEILIRRAERMGLPLTIYNPNDGALIDGTLPTPQASLPSFDKIDKNAVIQKIINDTIKPLSEKSITERKFKKQHLRDLNKFRHKIDLPARVKNPTDLQRAMRTIFKNILN
ncbi:MAG TPA: 6-hydroxymethylpterin diphosphokinase MptE-like protein, partial [Marinagarivorans sp.]